MALLITSASTALTVAAGVMAAYALARYRFPGNGAIYLFFLACLMIPLKLAIIPLFIQLKNPRPDRHPRRPCPGLHGDGAAFGDFHHDRLSARAAVGT